MIQTSDLWDKLAANPDHLIEYYVDIAGERYNNDEIKDISITSPLFDVFSIGNACSAQLDLVLYTRANPPPMAEITVYVRLSYGVEKSEWIQRGVFYVDTREVDPWGLVTITAYDAMLKTEQTFEVSNIGTWPNTITNIVAYIAQSIGVELDPRNKYTEYSVSYPLNYSLREVLCHIAVSNAGNWYITHDNKLRLLRFTEIPEETNFLVTSKGEAILFGDVRLIV